jgi:hypothetical protein
MLQRLLLRGLNEDESFEAFSHILFSPFLREQIGVKECLECCDKLIGFHFFAKQPAQFVAEYEHGRAIEQATAGNAYAIVGEPSMGHDQS